MTKDAVIFPIQITFDRVGESGAVREVKRTLFGVMNSYPSKKVITFNKHRQDFDFDVKYDELTHLDEEEINILGSKTLSRVQLKNITDILEKSENENVVSKGIKAHFSLDDSGIFDLINVELLLEKTVTPDENQNTFQKISNTITKLFTGSETESESEVPTKTNDQLNSNIENSTDSSQENNTITSGDQKEMNNTGSLKVVTIKETLLTNVSILYVNPLDDEQLATSTNKV